LTIFHKSIIAGAVEIAKIESDPTLDIVYFEPDGTVVSANRSIFYAASPARKEITAGLPFNDVPLISTCAIPTKQLVDFLKSIPTDKQFKGKLEYISITTGAGNMLTATIHDGRGPRMTVLRTVKPHPATVGWRNVFKSLNKAVSGGLGRFVYNRARLNAVVSAIDAACKYDGTFSLIEQTPFEAGYLWRAFNQLTGQYILIAFKMLLPADVPPVESWERNVLSANKKPLIRPR
jgi:hypothetical protein